MSKASDFATKGEEMSRSGKHAPMVSWCNRCRPDYNGPDMAIRLCPVHAAAPALLEALKRVLEYECNPEGCSSEAHLKARAAIAAAEEGRICSCEGDGHEDGCVVVERR